LSVHVVILAAGQGKRMMSDLPKVAQEVAGHSLVAWVLKAVEPLAPASTVVVLGHGAEVVEPLLPDGVMIAIQESQHGTGHAAQVGIDAISAMANDDIVVVLYGDTPLLTSGLIGSLADLQPGETARLITAHLEDPSGYGRVIRDEAGSVVAIVEDRDCTSEQREIDEINAGLYAVRAGALVAALDKVTNDNVQGEYYLTDVVGILVGKGDRLEAVKASAKEVAGINTQDQLAAAQKELQTRINQRLMDSGVWMLDPDRTYIEETVEVEPGARIYPGVHLEGSTTVAADAQIGPEVFAVDTSIGVGSTVWYSVLRGAVVGEGCEVGPYASLRSGTVLEAGSKIGTFVETKNTTMKEGAKANHQAYLGDATVGARSNIGAGTVTVNYDGVDKHPTEIGEDAFIGSDTMLVAPIRIGDRASTGAGSVITKDVPDDALGIERSGQKEIPGYSHRRQERKAKRSED
jgi:bifunctional UDP-N-acetylglucosamine pyrophosphorylase / glucosamine-1-phosphate N-acetyltransferase